MLSEYRHVFPWTLSFKSIQSDSAKHSSAYVIPFLCVCFFACMRAFARVIKIFTQFLNQSCPRRYIWGWSIESIHKCIFHGSLNLFKMIGRFCLTLFLCDQKRWSLQISSKDTPGVASMRRIQVGVTAFVDGWMTCVLRPFQRQDDGRVIMKGCVQWNPFYAGWEDFALSGARTRHR